jgi:hypothetical protein
MVLLYNYCIYTVIPYITFFKVLLRLAVGLYLSVNVYSVCVILLQNGYSIHTHGIKSLCAYRVRLDAIFLNISEYRYVFPVYVNE